MARIRIPIPVEHALSKGYQDAIEDTTGCQRILRKVTSFRDGTHAREWAKRQDWYPRLVRATKDVRWFVWFVRPEVQP